MDGLGIGEFVVPNENEKYKAKICPVLLAL